VVKRAKRAILLLAFAAAVPLRAEAQDVLVRARAAAQSGRRAEALTMLEARLAEAPRDVDARLLYGLVLSWESRYDEARPVLQQVLAQAPSYTDARVALMNVEYWSGQSREARAQADQILSEDPGNVTARAVRERLDAASRPWWAKASYRLDTFDDGTDPWQEVWLSITRQTLIGSLVVRGSHASRFQLDDQLVELEFYPRFRAGSYAFISAGFATDSMLYPGSRYAFDVYQSIGRGFEISGGARFLNFTRTTDIYLGTLTKYIGNWMLTGKVYHVPGEGDLDSTSYHGLVRRYFGADGTSYTGFSYNHGFSREDVRSSVDLLSLNSDTLYGEFDVVVGTRWRLSGSGGVSHEERVNRDPLWQTTITTGLSVRF
jgi:YaiO family outer membrane protein